MRPARSPSRGSQLLVAWRGSRLQARAAELLEIDPVSYNRFERGIRKPTAKVGLNIERLTGGRVTLRSWFEPPIAKRAA
jgi:hypothetical protein